MENENYDFIADAVRQLNGTESSRRFWRWAYRQTICRYGLDRALTDFGEMLYQTVSEIKADHISDNYSGKTHRHARMLTEYINNYLKHHFGRIKP